MPINLQLDRRTLLRSLACLTATVAVSPRALLAEGLLGAPLPARGAGEMDIHHLDTGRGNCTLIVAPDGTAIMIDAGAANVAAATSSDARPDASRRAGEWQGRYAARYVPNARLDYFITTHVHPDHIGDIAPNSPSAANSNYKRTGVSDVDHLLPIAVLIDRAFPDYGATPPPPAPFAENYLAYLQARQRAGRIVERARIGSIEQVTLQDRGYRGFKVRMLAANAKVWTGTGAQTTSALPPSATQAHDAHGNENLYSIALRIEHGRFSYFTGGDLTFDTHDGREPWMDVESPVARAAGRTEVAVANHHGYFDACGPEFVRALDAQAYIVPAWDIGHPGSAQMQRMLGQWEGSKATHDVFTTDLLPANALLNRRFAPQLKSQHGHVIVRVAADGDSFRIFTVDSTKEIGNVTGTSGPYHCRRNGMVAPI